MISGLMGIKQQPLLTEMKPGAQTGGDERRPSASALFGQVHGHGKG